VDADDRESGSEKRPGPLTMAALLARLGVRPAVPAGAALLFLLALWSSSAGMTAIIDTLNRAYDPRARP
jgi:hypothetical protein